MDKMAQGPAKKASQEDLEKDELGFTNPNLHRRIADDIQGEDEVAPRDYTVLVGGTNSYRTTTIHTYQDPRSSSAVIQELTVTENGDYIAAEGVDGYNPLHVNVPAPIPVLSTLTATENNTYTPESPSVGFSEVVVNVQPELEDITITQNGNYKSSQYYGYDDVIVNVVPTLSTLTATQNITYTPTAPSVGFLSVQVNVQPDLETLYVTENGEYTSSQHDGYSTVTVDVAGGGGVEVTSIDIVDALPETLVEGAVYLIPNGEQIVPPLPLTIDPTMNRWCVCCSEDAQESYPRGVPKEVAKSSTKFWAYAKSVPTNAEPQSFVGVPSTRGSYPDEITMGDGNSITLPTYIYEYDTTGNFEWVDITSTITSTEWNNDVVKHDRKNVLYTTYSMIRRSLNHISYETAWNLIDTNGRLIRTGDVDEYLVYLVESGVAVSKGSHTLKWVATNYS